MQRKSVKALIFSLVVFAAISAGPLFHSARAAGPKTPPVGLHVWTKSHAKISNPSDRLGGPLKVEVTQTNGSTRFIIPGPRALDPSVMGTPASPAGLEPAPFPLYGVPLKMRLKYKDQYSITNAATPFSDWREVGVGSVRMSLVDATATDGARTKDKIDFEANFKLPDGTHYRVVVKKPIPHGFAFPYFGGVVTNQILHGASGIGTKLMPSEFAYAAFWGVGDVYRDGKLVNKDHLVHAMLTEAVRGDNYKLVFDRDIGNPPATRTLHLMIPPLQGVGGLQGARPGSAEDQFHSFFLCGQTHEAGPEADRGHAGRRAERAHDGRLETDQGGDGPHEGACAGFHQKGKDVWNAFHPHHVREPDNHLQRVVN